MTNANIEIEQDRSFVVARMHDEHVTHCMAEELIEMLRSAMRFDNATQFLIDLTAVKFLSSACLGALVEFLQDVESVKGRLAICGASNDVTFLFKVTRLDTLFPLFEDESDARENLGDRSIINSGQRY
ncbi:MAG: STAS domain-containing protein [Phycisphaeraceae bacterium]|nr:STAS domain-containing protein [Phycisphaeraceae bacterium]